MAIIDWLECNTFIPNTAFVTWWCSTLARKLKSFVIAVCLCNIFAFEISLNIIYCGFLWGNPTHFFHTSIYILLVISSNCNSIFQVILARIGNTWEILFILTFMNIVKTYLIHWLQYSLSYLTQEIPDNFPQTAWRFSFLFGGAPALYMKLSLLELSAKDATMLLPHPVVLLIASIGLQSHDSGIGMHGSLLNLFLSQL